MQQLPGGEEVDEQQRKREAWGAVARGFSDGLAALLPEDDDYRTMRRCLEQSSRLARQRHLTLVRSPQPEPVDG